MPYIVSLATVLFNFVGELGDRIAEVPDAAKTLLGFYPKKLL